MPYRPGAPAAGARDRRRDGVTIIEIVVAIAIIALLSGVGLISFKGMAAKAHLKAAAGGGRSALDLARNAAITLGRDVSLAVDTAGRSYTIFIDLNRDGAYQAGADSLIKAIKPEDTLATVKLDSGTAPVSVFSANGSLNQTIYLLFRRPDGSRLGLRDLAATGLIREY